MSGPAQVIVLAAFIISGGVLFGIGWDMANHPTVYKTLGVMGCLMLGWTLMVAAFVPAVVISLLMFRWSREFSEEFPIRKVHHLGLPGSGNASVPNESVQDSEGLTVSVASLSTAQGDQPLVPADDVPYLIGLTGGLPNRVKIHAGKFLIGRSPECDLVLSSQLVSRKHAELKWNDDVLMIRDLGSSNATLINDHPIENEAVLSEGDVIQIVDYSLEVELPVSLAKTMIRPRMDEDDESLTDSIRIETDDSET